MSKNQENQHNTPYLNHTTSIHLLSLVHRKDEECVYRAVFIQWVHGAMDSISLLPS